MGVPVINFSVSRHDEKMYIYPYLAFYVTTNEKTKIPHFNLTLIF